MGQLSLLGAGKPPAISGGANLLLDDLSVSAARAYSTRKLRAAYSGNCMKVRRASDSTTQDIGFSAGELDTSALATFCSGTDGFIHTWFDQSTNAKDIVNTTAAQQPRIVTSGSVLTKNSKPAPLWPANTTATYLSESTSFTCAEVLAVLDFDGASFPDYCGALNGAGGASPFGLLGSSGSTDWVNFGDLTTIINNNSSSTPSASAILSATLGQVNGRGSGGTWAGAFVGGNAVTASRYWKGHIGDAIFFPSALSGADRTAAYNEQKAYWGTP